jgi:hypothetical protein
MKHGERLRERIAPQRKDAPNKISNGAEGVRCTKRLQCR